MADIELVFKINEKDYDDILNGETKASALNYSIFNAIRNGTPLPKGHGDLKDVEKLKQAFIKWSMAVQGYFTDSDIASIVYNSPTIIEADKAGSEDNE